MNLSPINKQRILKKTKCPLLLQIIEDIILKHNLKPTFTKVTAHSNDKLNDMANKLVKQGLQKQDGITINNKKMNWPIYTISLYNFSNNSPATNSLDISTKALLDQ